MKLLNRSSVLPSFLRLDNEELDFNQVQKKRILKNAGTIETAGSMEIGEMFDLG